MNDKDNSLDSKIDKLAERIAYFCEDNDQASLLDLILSERSEADRLGRIDELKTINGYLNEVNEVHICYEDIGIMGEQINDRISNLTQQSNGDK